MGKRKIGKVVFVAAGLVAVAAILLFLFYGDNFRLFTTFFRKDITSEEIRETAKMFGARGVVSIGLLAMMQVILMFLPAEPVQVVAGAGYGLWTGVLICTAGVFVGNTLIYIAYKIFGNKMSDYYSKNVKIDWKSAKTARGISLIVLILYILPAIPYGMICFFAASTGLKYPRYIILTVLGAVPSVFIGVGLGHLAVAASLVSAAIVFVVLVIIILIMFIKRDALTARLNAYIATKSKPYTSDTSVKKPNGFVSNVLVGAFNIYLFFKFRIKFKNKVGKLSKPSIVLVNHGAFIYFIFSLKFLIKYKPNVIAARLYFYHRQMGVWMKRCGVFPKSMFSADLENAKNCLKVIKNKGMILMMPEARLSTVGRYEGIQESTVRFLYKTGADLYTLKIDGNYFAMPKWGDKPRTGAPLECTLEKLYSSEQLKNTDYDTFARSLDEAMDYDSFKWLASRPQIRYKSKTLAEGLEGILYLCPKCGRECTIETSGRTVRCSACGMETRLTDRYEFEGGYPFKNFQEWYDYQCAELKKKTEADAEYRLTARVELKHSSKDGKTCVRHAGAGECTLTAQGLEYFGTEDGKDVRVFFEKERYYRLLFGANEDFELYDGKEIYYFVPQDKRICVKWYIASCIFGEKIKG